MTDQKGSTVIKKILFLSAFIGVHHWQNGLAFAAPATPAPAAAAAKLDAAAKALDKAKSEVQALKESWDKARLESTLYDQRAKRAYQKWTKAAKGLKKEAAAQKDRAELEFKLAIERRKLAWNEWQAAQYRREAQEAMVKALAQEKDIGTVRARMGELEKKLEAGRSSSAVRPPQKVQE